MPWLASLPANGGSRSIWPRCSGIAGTGTLGCLLDTTAGRCVLSNNHVLAVSNAAILGDEIRQPSLSDGSSSNTPTRIATLTDFEPLSFGSAVNRIDAAIAALDDVDSAIPDIMTIAPPPANPPVAPLLGQSVVKHGRTTGLTFGSVVDTSFDGNVHYDGAVAYFEHQIVVVGDAGPFSERGDSGSLVRDTSGSHPVGLLFACDDSQTIANPIQFVLNRFGATVAVTWQTFGKPSALSVANSAPLTASWGSAPAKTAFSCMPPPKRRPSSRRSAASGAPATRASPSRWFSPTVSKPTRRHPDALMSPNWVDGGCVVVYRENQFRRTCFLRRATPLRGPVSRATHRASFRVTAHAGFDPCRGNRQSTLHTPIRPLSSKASLEHAKATKLRHRVPGEPSKSPKHPTLRGR